MMAGDSLLTEKLIKEGRNLGVRLPSLPAPGRLTENPIVTNRRIAEIRAEQAPKPDFVNTPSYENRPIVPRTMVPIAGPRQRGGAMVPLGEVSRPRPEIPSTAMDQGAPVAADLVDMDSALAAARSGMLTRGGKTFDPFQTGANPPIPGSESILGDSGEFLGLRFTGGGNITGAESTQEALGRYIQARAQKGAVAPRDIVSSTGRVTPEGANIGGRMIPFEGIGPDPSSIPSMSGATSSFAPRVPDPFVDEQLSIFVKANPESELAKAIQRFESQSFTAPSVPAAQSSTDEMVMASLLRNLSDRDRQAIAAGGALATLTGLANMMPGREGEVPVSPTPMQTPIRPVPTEARSAPIVPVGPASQVVDETANNAATGEPGAGADALVTTNPPTPTQSITPPGSPTNTETSAQRDLVRAAVASDQVAAEAIRLTEPMSPEKYGSLAEYRQAVAAYSGQPTVKKELIEFVRGTGSSPEMSDNLATWAQANPALAYALQQREYARQSNQQSGEVASSASVGSSLGNNIVPTAEANALSAGLAAVEGNPGSFDMKSATDKIISPEISRKPSPNLITSYLNAVGSGYPKPVANF